MKISEIKKGDRFFEESYGFVVSYEALEDAKFIETSNKTGWIVKAKGKIGEVEFFHNDRYPAYAPKIKKVENWLD